MSRHRRGGFDAAGVHRPTTQTSTPDPTPVTRPSQRAPQPLMRSRFGFTGATVLPIPPPLYYGAAVAAGLLLDSFIPLPIPAPSVTGPAGGLILAAGLGLNFGAVGGVIAHKTTIVPHAHVNTLVTSGVYRVSRNPMYTGLAGAVAGVSLLVGSWWPLILLPAALVAVRKLVIDPEERYLDERFGSIYASYKAQTPRWI